MDKMHKKPDAVRLGAILFTAALILCLFVPAVCEETIWWFPDRLDVPSDEVEYAYIAFPGKWILAAIALVRCGLLLVKAKVTDIISLAPAAISGLWMLVVPWLCNVNQPMGGLAGYDYWLTPFGWMLVASNAMAMVFTIILLIKKR